MFSEGNIIQYLKTNFPIGGGIGDDAAILPYSAHQDYVITKDLLVEDIHFKCRYVDASSLAHKALQANLSDVAAMGARPTHVLLGIGIPKQANETYVNLFLKHFAEICKTNEIILIGGDTTRSPDKLFISVTALGLAEKSNLKFRNKAKIGNTIYATGPLGYAHLGLNLLEKDISAGSLFKKSFLKPEAKIKEGQWCGRHEAVTAMMDISDGLFIDLKRLCTASKVSAEINLDHLNISSEFEKICNSLKLVPVEIALIGGEDYGLLFTVDDPNALLFQDFTVKFDYPLINVGKIIPGEGDIFFKKAEQPISLSLTPYSHFNEL